MSATFSPAAAIRELALAWKTLTVYPKGHPAAGGATDEALRQIRGLAATTGALVVAVGRDALVIDGERYDGAHAARLAVRLHELEVGVVRFLEGISEAELVELLGLLGSRREDPRTLPARVEEARIEGALVGEARLARVVVEPIDLSRLSATDDLETTPPSQVPSASPSLWDRILSQQAEGSAVGGADPETGLRAVLELVRACLARLPGGASALTELAADGLSAAPEMVALATQLAEAVGEHTALALRGGRADLREVAALVAALPPGLRERALDAALGLLATSNGGGDGIAMLAVSIPPAELIPSLRRLRAQGRRLAAPAIQWLGAMVETGAVGAVGGRTASAKELEALLAEPDDTPGWGPELVILELPSRPLPQLTIPSSLAPELGRLGPGGAIQELLGVLLELIERAATADQSAAVTGRLQALLETLVEGGRIRAAVALVRHLRARAGEWGDDERARALLRTLERASGSTMVELVLGQLGDSSPDEVEELHELVEELGPRMTRQLLLTLAESDDRHRRRRLLAFLGRGSTQVVAAARQLLVDQRWFVVRNMVSLLHTIGSREVLDDLRRCLEHSDARVRIEALRALTELDRRLSPELIARMLADPDPKVAERMAHLAGQLDARAALEPLLAIVTPLDPFGRQRTLRIKALLALGEIGDARALGRIKRFFSAFSVDPIDERRAAYQSLAGYPPEARRELVEKGLGARDAEIRATCQALAGGQRG